MIEQDIIAMTTNMILTAFRKRKNTVRQTL